MRKKVFYLTLLGILCLVINACGQSGKLYLPGDKTAEKKLAPEHD